MEVKFFLLLNVFFVLAIFARAHGSFPFIIESTGALELQQVKRTSDQHILLGGTFTNTLSYQGHSLASIGEEDVFLMSVDPQGELQWMKSFGGVFDDDLSAVFVGNEQIWLAGGFRDRAFFDTLDLSSPDGSRSVFLLKMSTNGQILSHKQMDSPGLKSVTGIVSGSGEELYVGGYFRGELVFDDLSIQAVGETNMMLLKLDDNENWSVILQAGQKGNSRIEQLVLDSLGQLIIGGTFDDQLVLGPDTLSANTFDKDVFVAALDTSGQLQWSLKAGGVFDKELVRLTIDSEGNIYGAGQLVGVMKFSDNLSIQSQNGNTDIYWFLLDPSGQPIKAETLGGTDAEVLTDLLLTETSFWLCGNFQGSFSVGDQDLDAGLSVGSFLIELDQASGNAMSSESLTSSVAAFIYQLIPLGPRSVLAAGSFSGELRFGGENLDAGGAFWGFLTDFDPLSTSVRSSALFHIRLYPNPFHDQIFVDSPEAIERVWLFDSWGRLRWQGTFTSNYLSVPFLEKGSYQILVKARNGEIARQSIIKQ